MWTNEFIQEFWVSYKLLKIKIFDYSPPVIIIHDVALKKMFPEDSLLNPLSANPEKWSNTLKQIVGKLPTICLNVFDHFMNLAFKGLTMFQ